MWAELWNRVYALSIEDCSRLCSEFEFTPPRHVAYATVEMTDCLMNWVMWNAQLEHLRARVEEMTHVK